MMVFMDMTATEELLTVLPMKERTQGEDIFQSLSRKPSCHCGAYHGWLLDRIHHQVQGG